MCRGRTLQTQGSRELQFVAHTNAANSSTEGHHWNTPPDQTHRAVRLIVRSGPTGTMIADLIATAKDGQRVDLTAIVSVRGVQTTSKAGSFKRTLLLADSSGCIELTLLCEGAVTSGHLARGDLVVAKNAKFGLWNGKSSLVMFSAPLGAVDADLSAWWTTTGSESGSMSIETLQGLPDQTAVQSVVGLVVSTEDVSSTKSGGTKRKFSLVDASTRSPIDVCFAGKLSVEQPPYTVGSVICLPSAVVGVWQDTRSLLVFEPPVCLAEDDAAAKDVYAWVLSGGAACHRPLSIQQFGAAIDDTRVDLTPVVVSGVSERTMTAGGHLWKRNIQIVDESTGGEGVGIEICTVGAAADVTLCVGDVISIRRAKVSTFNGIRGAVIYDAPGHVTDCHHLVDWWAATKKATNRDALPSPIADWPF